MESWSEFGLLAFASYIAVMGLVRLMQWKRRMVLDELQREQEKERANSQSQPEAQEKDSQEKKKSGKAA